MIDHSLLHPAMTDAEIATGLSIAAKYKFPAGNSTTEVKVFEATKAAEAGGKEIDMVLNIGKALGGDWDYAVVSKGSILKVIFENDFLTDAEIVKLCHICSEDGVAFVKTSTGYGFVKQSNGMYNYQGATLPHLSLMRENVEEGIQIKAAGGVRTLDDLLRVRILGVMRVGATAIEAILEEAMRRGIGEELVEVNVPPLSSV
ncbi:hypothetical protein BPAE_0224g00020 [Botrytis paeoniae]|uniref:Uncharacterized protein n=1 Tax=Botrytis paeoniae TaxID=278948 RepID=A0A4Z1F9B0_9HELO|nr:hypothetical protein BPAE_0224g00020 [Botrytis paeoniae]